MKEPLMSAKGYRLVFLSLLIKKMLISLLLLFNFTYILYSQTSSQLSGKIINDINEPVSYATVSLFKADQSLIKSTISDSLGHFTIYDPPIAGTLHIAHITHDSYSEPLLPSYKEAVTIVLIRNSTELEAAVVQGEKRTFAVRDGNIIANISSIPGVKSMSSSKILGRLPGVVKDSKGSFTLNGTNAVLYIDGVKQNLTPQALESYLESLPASVLSEVELLATPPASYDATAQAVINIKLNKQMPEGTIFDLGLFSGFQKDYIGDTGIEAFYMVKKNSILFNSTFNYTNSTLYQRGSDSTVFGQNMDAPISNTYKNTGRYNSLTLNSNLTLSLKNDYKLDFNAFVYCGLPDSKYHNTTDRYDGISPFPNQEWYRTKSDGFDDRYSATVKYSSPEDRTFNFSAYYGGMYGGIRSDNDYFKFDSPSGWQKHMNSELEMEGQMHTLKVDFKNRVSNKITIEYGTKADFNVINDKATYITSLSSNLENSQFRGQEWILAAFASISYQISERFSAYAALRGEYTDYDLNLKSDEYKKKNDYSDLFPSARLTYRSNPYTVTISYNSFIRRQNYMDLLPGERYVNEYYSTQGNPELEPTIFKVISVQNSFLKGAFSLLLQYQKVEDFYENVLMLKNSKTVLSPLNYTDRENYALLLNIPIMMFNSRFYGNFSATASWIKYPKFHSDFIMPLNRDKSYSNHHMNFNFQYEITDRLIIDYSCLYHPKYKNLLLEKKNMWRMDAGLSYAFLRNKQLILSTNVENIFDSYDSKVDNFFGNNYRYTLAKSDGPIFSFSLKLKFNKGRNISTEYIDSRQDMSRMQK